MKSSASTLRLPFTTLLIVWALGIISAEGQVSIVGEIKKWHKVTLLCAAANTSEADSINPFTDFRLTVTFTNGAATHVVPGFYAADGNAAETSASGGDKWIAHFTPDVVGEWNYSVSFRTAPYIAVSNDSGISVPPLDGASGSFFVQQPNKTGNDFRAKGMLRYVGGHHLQFAETEEYFLKGGTNSPENFLAYFEFDQTSDLGGINDNTLVNGLHQYAPHVQHWQQGDPAWQNGKGKGIIGALNYLAAQNVNSVYFMPYTIDGGDGRDTWMWTSPTERERFDCSKLAQWEIVFSHMDSLGIQLHLVTQEQENDQSLGDSLQQLNNIRKLYYRELVARFSHHLALQWNVGEENTNTHAERAAFAEYIRAIDPYDHPIALHTTNGTAPTFYDTIFATPSHLQFFEAASLQGIANKYNSWAIQLRNKSTLAGKKWAIYGDEQIPSVAPDGSDFDELRRDALWGNLMGGGAGVEWYFGYQSTFGDLQTEDFTLVEQLWKYTSYALEFFENHLPFHEMSPQNNLLVNSVDEDYCFAKPGQIYAAYLETGGSSNLRISLQPGNYIVRWFNPRTGGALQSGSVTAINAASSGNYTVGMPPSGTAGDWVVLLTNEYEAMTLSSIVNDAACFENQDGSIEIFVSGGAPPFVYQWSHGANTNIAQQLAAGTYSVTIADAFLHSISDTFLITQPDVLQAQSNATINNGLGEITLLPVGGTPPYSFSWSSGDKTSTTDSLASGNYCATITDANGCRITLCDTIVIPPCAYPPFTCSDNNPCTVDSCINGNCISTLLQCDDENNCTIDYCVNGQCVFAAITCSDGNLCTADNCIPESGCIFTPVVCDDQIACTVDSCLSGECIFTAANCNDGNLCTIDNCDTIGQCVYTPVTCDDNILCTADACLPQSGCAFTQIICADDGNLCTIESCEQGVCISTQISCNDNNACTIDACNNGQCVYTPVICNDNNSCTTDNCDNGVCVYTNITCNDNNPCTTDACNSGQCIYTAIICNDNNPCTNDACSNGQCVYTPASLQVSSLTLVNSVTDLDVRTLKDSDTINLAVTPSVNIRANTCPSVKSVKFALNGSTFRTESSIPFSLAGDASGNYNKWNVSVGLYTLVTTPYSGLNAGGTTGTPKTITIRVINQVAPACTSNANCNDNNSCTNNVCQSGQCVFTPINCSDNKPCTNDFCNNGICSNVAIVCNDNNLCTSDACENGNCIYTPINCNDNNACTADNCNAGQCSNTILTCNDNNSCTIDGCNTATGCTNAPIANCCSQNSNCNDNNPCTIDICANGSCTYTQGGSEPSYLRITNPSKSWRKLKLGYSPTSYFSPKQNVTATGNNQMCITLRTVGTPEWSKIQIRPQGGSSAAVTLSNYITGTAQNWTTFCIPLNAFTGFNFSQISFLEMPYSNGAATFEIHVKKILFSGGATPFLWFGDSKTDNIHDGQSGSGSALIAILIAGNPCASKMSDEESIPADAENHFHLNAYPNPFSNELNIEFSLPKNAHAKIEIFNLSGQLLDVLFDGNVQASALQRIEYKPEITSGGVLIYKLQTQQTIYYGKAMMVK